MSILPRNSKTLEEKYNMAKRRKTLSGVNFDLREIEPLTRNQLKAFDATNNLVLHGLAGTGKTFISSYLAFDDMAKGDYQASNYTKCSTYERYWVSARH